MFTLDTTSRPRRAAFGVAAGLVVFMTFASGTAHAQGQPSRTGKAAEAAAYKTPATRERNAALEYMTLRDTFSPEFLKLVAEEYRSETGWSPSEKLSVLLEENQPLIRRLMEASKLPTSDFGIRYEDGFDALLPHLSHMRQFSRVLAADARRLAIGGRTDDAAERLITCFRMAAHLTQDKILISSLVSMAISSLALGQAEMTARDYGMNDAARREVIKAARSLLTKDSFGTRGCIQMEKQLALASIRPNYKGKGENAGRELARKLRGWQLGDEAAKDVEKLNEEQIDAQLDLLDRYYATLTNLWDAKDAEVRLKELEERLAKGEFGVLVRNIAPALSKSRTSTTKAVKEIQDVTALLEAGMSQPAAPSPAQPVPAAEPETHDDGE